MQDQLALAQALAGAINARMHERGMTQRDLAERSGVSIATLQRIRAAQPQRRSTVTLAAISRALGWSEDHLRNVLYGQSQAESETRALQRQVDELTARIDELTSRLHLLEGHDLPDRMHSLEAHISRRAVVAAVVTSDLGVLIGKRHDGMPPWTFIAGTLDIGESPADAAIREVKEETGCLITTAEIIGRRVHPATGRTMIYLAATPAHGTEVFVGDEQELEEVRWVKRTEAEDLMPDMFERVRTHLRQVI